MDHAGGGVQGAASPADHGGRLVPPVRETGQQFDNERRQLAHNAALISSAAHKALQAACQTGGRLPRTHSNGTLPTMPARQRAVAAKRRQQRPEPEPEPEPDPEPEPEPERVPEQRAPQRRQQARRSSGGGGRATTAGEPGEQQSGEERLITQVARAVALEETGKLQEALALYEPVYAAYKAACRPRPKLLRRIIDVRRRLSVEQELGVVMQGSASGFDVDAAELRMRARRIGEREREQQQAVVRIQASFRGRKLRSDLAERRSAEAEKFMGDSQQSEQGDGSSVVSRQSTQVEDVFMRAARRGRLRTEAEIEFMERGAAAREQELAAEAARAKQAEAEAMRLRTQLEFFRNAQPELAARLEDDLGRAEMSAALTASLAPLQAAAGQRKQQRAGGKKPSVPWTMLCATPPMTVRFNTLSVRLSGPGAASTAVRLSLLRKPEGGSAGALGPDGPIAGTGWSRYIDHEQVAYFLLQGHHPSEDDTGGGMFTALYDYPEGADMAAVDEGTLVLKAGDVVEVTERSDPDWCDRRSHCALLSSRFTTRFVLLIVCCAALRCRWVGKLRNGTSGSEGSDGDSIGGYFPAQWVMPYGAVREVPAEVTSAAALLDGSGVGEMSEVYYCMIPKIEAVDHERPASPSAPPLDVSTQLIANYLLLTTNREVHHL